MKFLHYLIYDAPGAFKISICAAISGLGLTELFEFITSAESVSLAKALCAWGGVITMGLAWVHHFMKIRKEAK